MTILDRPITERYRPRRLSDLVGQPGPVQVLREFCARPHSEVFLFTGGVGVGKTSAALCIAAELGCDVEQVPSEFGGVHCIASGEQNAESVRALADALHLRPMFSRNGYKVVVINEADSMTKTAEALWADVLENLPPRCVVVFTTNEPDRLTTRFRDRCRAEIVFADSGPAVEAGARELALRVALAEADVILEDAELVEITQAAQRGGRYSFRRIVRETEVRVTA